MPRREDRICGRVIDTEARGEGGKRSSPRRGAGGSVGRQPGIVDVGGAVDDAVSRGGKEPDGVWPSEESMVRWASSDADRTRGNEDGIFVNEGHGIVDKGKRLMRRDRLSHYSVCSCCLLTNISPGPNLGYI